MKDAVAYMRMSTDRQEHSIESQKRLIFSFAEQNGYVIRHCYIDEGISGRKAEKRPQFLQMIEDSTKGEFRFILIYDSSRFARNLEQSLVYKSILKRNGVEILSITEPVLDDDTSLITDALFGAMNEMYSRKLSKNVKRGMEQKALRGEFCGNEPFGYDYDSTKKMLIPNPVEAPIARYIFHEIRNGRTPYSIASEMREKNIRSKNGAFLQPRRIEYMIHNPVYKGYIRWTCDDKLIVQKSCHEALLSPEEFILLQKITEDRTRHFKKNAKPATVCRHWLSGLIYCSECGCVYTYVKAREQEGKKARFRCSGQSRGRCSSGISFRIEILEKQVFCILQEILESDGDFYMPSPPLSTSVKKDYSEDIKKLKRSLGRANQAFLAGLDSLSEYGEHKKKLIAEIAHLETLQVKQLATETEDRPLSATPVDLITLLKEHEDMTTKRDALHAIVEKLVIEKTTKHITLYFFA